MRGDSHGSVETSDAFLSSVERRPTLSSADPLGSRVSRVGCLTTGCEAFIVSSISAEEAVAPTCRLRGAS